MISFPCAGRHAMITEMIDRNFGRAAIWCLIAADFLLVWIDAFRILEWGAQPMYAEDGRRRSDCLFRPLVER